MKLQNLVILVVLSLWGITIPPGCARLMGMNDEESSAYMLSSDSVPISSPQFHSEFAHVGSHGFSVSKVIPMKFLPSPKESPTHVFSQPGEEISKHVHVSSVPKSSPERDMSDSVHVDSHAFSHVFSVPKASNSFFVPMVSPKLDSHVFSVPKASPTNSFSVTKTSPKLDSQVSSVAKASPVNFFSVPKATPKLDSHVSSVPKTSPISFFSVPKASREHDMSETVHVGSDALPDVSSAPGASPMNFFSVPKGSPNHDHVSSESRATPEHDLAKPITARFSSKSATADVESSYTVDVEPDPHQSNGGHLN